MAKPIVTAAPTLPTNPLVDASDSVAENVGRAHALAAFLQTEAEQTHSGELKGEGYGRALAHQVLTDALAWLAAQATEASHV